MQDQNANNSPLYNWRDTLSRILPQLLFVLKAIFILLLILSPASLLVAASPASRERNNKKSNHNDKLDLSLDMSQHSTWQLTQNGNPNEPVILGNIENVVNKDTLSNPKANSKKGKLKSPNTKKVVDEKKSETTISIDARNFLDSSGKPLGIFHNEMTQWIQDELSGDKEKQFIQSMANDQKKIKYFKSIFRKSLTRSDYLFQEFAATNMVIRLFPFTSDYPVFFDITEELSGWMLINSYEHFYSYIKSIALNSPSKKMIWDQAIKMLFLYVSKTDVSRESIDRTLKLINRYIKEDNIKPAEHVEVVLIRSILSNNALLDTLDELEKELNYSFFRELRLMSIKANDFYQIVSRYLGQLTIPNKMSQESTYRLTVQLAQELKKARPEEYETLIKDIYQIDQLDEFSPVVFIDFLTVRIEILDSIRVLSDRAANSVEKSNAMRVFLKSYDELNKLLNLQDSYSSRLRIELYLRGLKDLLTENVEVYDQKKVVELKSKAKSYVGANLESILRSEFELQFVKQYARMGHIVLTYLKKAGRLAHDYPDTLVFPEKEIGEDQDTFELSQSEMQCTKPPEVELGFINSAMRFVNYNPLLSCIFLFSVGYKLGAYFMAVSEEALQKYADRLIDKLKKSYFISLERIKVGNGFSTMIMDFRVVSNGIFRVFSDKNEQAGFLEKLLSTDNIQVEVINIKDGFSISLYLKKWQLGAWKTLEEPVKFNWSDEVYLSLKTNIENFFSKKFKEKFPKLKEWKVNLRKFHANDAKEIIIDVSFDGGFEFNQLAIKSELKKHVDFENACLTRKISLGDFSNTMAFSKISKKEAEKIEDGILEGISNLQKNKRQEEKIKKSLSKIIDFGKLKLDLTENQLVWYVQDQPYQVGSKTINRQDILVFLQHTLSYCYLTKLEIKSDNHSTQLIQNLKAFEEKDIDVAELFQRLIAIKYQIMTNYSNVFDINIRFCPETGKIRFEFDLRKIVRDENKHISDKQFFSFLKKEICSMFKQNKKSSNLFELDYKENNISSFENQFLDRVNDSISLKKAELQKIADEEKRKRQVESEKQKEQKTTENLQDLNQRLCNIFGGSIGTEWEINKENNNEAFLEIPRGTYPIKLKAEGDFILIRAKVLWELLLDDIKNNVSDQIMLQNGTLRLATISVIDKIPLYASKCDSMLFSPLLQFKSTFFPADVIVKEFSGDEFLEVVIQLNDQKSFHSIGLEKEEFIECLKLAIKNEAQREKESVTERMTFNDKGVLFLSITLSELNRILKTVDFENIKLNFLKSKQSDPEKTVASMSKLEGKKESKIGKHKKVHIATSQHKPSFYYHTAEGKKKDRQCEGGKDYKTFEEEVKKNINEMIKNIKKFRILIEKEEVDVIGETNDISVLRNYVIDLLATLDNFAKEELKSSSIGPGWFQVTKDRHQELRNLRAAIVHEINKSTSRASLAVVARLLVEQSENGWANGFLNIQKTAELPMATHEVSQLDFDEFLQYLDTLKGFIFKSKQADVPDTKANLTVWVKINIALVKTITGRMLDLFHKLPIAKKSEINKKYPALYNLLENSRGMRNMIDHNGDGSASGLIFAQQIAQFIINLNELANSRKPEASSRSNKKEAKKSDGKVKANPNILWNQSGSSSSLSSSSDQPMKIESDRTVEYS